MTDTKHTRSRSSGCAIWAAVVAVLFVGLVAVFIANNRPPHIAIPTPKMPKDNAWDRFAAASNMMAHGGPLSDPNRKPDEWSMADYEVFIKGNAAGLAELRAGLSRPCMHPPVRSHLDDRLFSVSGGFRETARTLVGVALYHERLGDYGEAANARLDCIEFGAMIQRGGPFISSLVGCAVEGIGLEGMGSLLPRLSPDELAHMAARLEVIRGKRCSYSDIIIEESYKAAASDAALWTSPDMVKMLAHPAMWIAADFDLFMGYTSMGSTSRSHAQRITSNIRLAFGNKGRMLRENLEYCKALAAEQRGPYTGKSSVPLPKNPLAFSNEVLVKARPALERKEAGIAVIQTEVALRRYHLKHGRCPDKLSELVPAYLKRVPVDPLGLGKPLRYKPLDSGRDFLLYSLGPDLKDDGGTPQNPLDGSAPGDLVAGHLGTR